MSRLNIPTEVERFLQESEVALTISCPRIDGNPIVAANQSFCQLSGYDHNEVIGRNCRFLQGEETTKSSLATIRSAITSEREGQSMIRNYRKDGEAFDNFLFIFPVLGGDLRTAFFIGSQFEIPRQDRLGAIDNHVAQLVDGLDRMNEARRNAGRAVVETAKLAATTARSVLLSRIATLH